MPKAGPQLLSSPSLFLLCCIHLYTITRNTPPIDIILFANPFERLFRSRGYGFLIVAGIRYSFELKTRFHIAGDLPAQT